MKKTTIVRARIVFGNGGPKLLSEQGKDIRLLDLLPKFNNKAMEYDSETGWFQSPVVQFHIEVDTKVIE